MSIKKAKVSFVALIVAATSFIAINSATTANAATGWCSGVKIAAYPGGPQGGAFANNVYNGYKQAAEDLGADVKYYFSDWNAETLIKQMKEGLATNPDGMAIYGFGGAVLLYGATFYLLRYMKEDHKFVRTMIALAGMGALAALAYIILHLIVGVALPPPLPTERLARFLLFPIIMWTAFMYAFLFRHVSLRPIPAFVTAALYVLVIQVILSSISR